MKGGLNKVLPSWARVRLTWVWRLQREPGTGSLSWCSRSCRLPTHQCREYFDLRDLQEKKGVVFIKRATSQYSKTSFLKVYAEEGGFLLIYTQRHGDMQPFRCVVQGID